MACTWHVPYHNGFHNFHNQLLDLHNGHNGHVNFNKGLEQLDLKKTCPLCCLVMGLKRGKEMATWKPLYIFVEWSSSAHYVGVRYKGSPLGWARWCTRHNEEDDAIWWHYSLGWQVQTIFFKKSHPIDTFWSLLRVYNHHQKIMSYNVVKENDIICQPRPNCYGSMPKKNT
jgi:hypothetical protein